MKARRLKNLRIKRVDLVERGANQFAHVMLFKAADMKPCKECGKAMKADLRICPECDAKVNVAAKAAGGSDMAENVEQIKKLQDDLKAAEELATEEAKKREAVEKSLKDQAETLANLKKRLDDSEAEIKKAQDSAKLAEFKKAVDAFEHLPVKADIFGPVLKACAEALDEDGYKELMRVLKAADAASAENFAEVGAPGNSTESKAAAAEVQEKAEALIAKNAKLTELEATAQVLSQNPKLALRYRRESYASRQDN